MPFLWSIFYIFELAFVAFVVNSMFTQKLHMYYGYLEIAHSNNMNNP